MPFDFNKFLLVTATIDELLSSTFLAAQGQKADADQAGLRLAAWCKSAASGDWQLFAKRLKADGLSFEDVLSRLATASLDPNARPPAWWQSAPWVIAALQSQASVGIADVLRHLYW